MKSIPVEKKSIWEERVELARMRFSEIIDLDQDPPVKYGSIRCALALSELEELDKLHKQTIDQEVEKREREIARQIDSFPLTDSMFFDESNWKAGYKALEEFKLSLITKK